MCAGGSSRWRSSSASPSPPCCGWSASRAGPSRTLTRWRERTAGRRRPSRSLATILLVGAASLLAGRVARPGGAARGAGRRARRVDRGSRAARRARPRAGPGQRRRAAGRVPRVADRAVDPADPSAPPAVGPRRGGDRRRGSHGLRRRGVAGARPRLRLDPRRLGPAADYAAALVLGAVAVRGSACCCAGPSASGPRHRSAQRPVVVRGRRLRRRARRALSRRRSGRAVQRQRGHADAARAASCTTAPGRWPGSRWSSSRSPAGRSPPAIAAGSSSRRSSQASR